MPLEDLFWRFLVTIVFGLGIVPAAGGAIIWKTFQIGKITNFTYVQCWKAYLGGCGYAYMACMIINLFQRNSKEFEGLQLVLFCLIPFLVVPLFLRDFTRRVMAVQALGLLIINALVLAFILFSRLH
jgi:hypothetical protein